MDQGHIDSLPKFPKVNGASARRPHFDAKDWQKLTRHLQEFVKIENRSTRRDRMMLRDYVLILANTGIRVGEARTLKWRDVTEIAGEAGVAPLTQRFAFGMAVLPRHSARRVPLMMNLQNNAVVTRTIATCAASAVQFDNVVPELHPFSMTIGVHPACSLWASTLAYIALGRKSDRDPSRDLQSPE